MPNASKSCLEYRIVPVTAFQQNCSIAWCSKTRETVVIDPGGELPRIEAALRELQLQPQAIWLTHGHIDHAGGAGELSQRLGIPVIGPQEEDQFWLDGLPQQAQAYGFAPALDFQPQRWLHDGDELQLGHCRFLVRHCPGHTPGHVVFYSEQARLAFVGDVLFAGSIGRTDFPRGNHADLIRSVCEKLWPMGDDVHFVPGHGPGSTFGQERRSNPFVGDAVTGLSRQP